MKKSKEALSPTISTVLLIMIVIVLALIILLWSRGFIKEAIMKEIANEEKRVEQYCSEVSISEIIEGDNFGFQNTGNVPIFKYKVKLSKQGDTTTIEGGSVNPGYTEMIPNQNYNEYENIKIIPILLGKRKSTGETEEFECENEFVIKSS